MAQQAAAVNPGLCCPFCSQIAWRLRIAVNGYSSILTCCVCEKALDLGVIYVEGGHARQATEAPAVDQVKE